MSRKNSLLSEIQKLDEIIPIADERAIDEFLCEDGKAQIDLNLNDGIELFNPLSFGKVIKNSIDMSGTQVYYRNVAPGCGASFKIRS